MSIYSFVDEAGLRLASRMIRSVRYFADNVKSRRLLEVPGRTEISLPHLEREAYIDARGSADGVDINPSVEVFRWVEPEAPLVIYHHGAAEGSYDFSFRKIFRHKSFTSGRVNVMAIKAPFSGTNREFYQAIRDMKQYTALISGSTVLVEKIIRQFRKRSNAAVFVTGTSLGGIVSCLHSRVFGSADCYLPLYAGPQLAEVFLDSAYAGICDETARVEHSEEIRRVLNFGEAFLAGTPERVFPLLGKSDMVFSCPLQLKYYRQENVTATEKGHSTGAVAFADLRSYILNAVHSRTEVKAEYAGR